MEHLDQITPVVKMVNDISDALFKLTTQDAAVGIFTSKKDIAVYNNLKKAVDEVEDLLDGKIMRIVENILHDNQHIQSDKQKHVAQNHSDKCDASVDHFRKANQNGSNAMSTSP